MFELVRVNTTTNRKDKAVSENKVTYVMPKVSVIMRDSGKLSAGMSYDYGYIRTVKKPIVERLLRGTFTFFGFCISMSLFVLSVSLTSFMLVSAANSPTVIHMKTQEVPSDGIERYYTHDQKMLKSIEK